MRYTTRQLIQISTGCEDILLGDKTKIKDLNTGVLLRLFSSHEFKHGGYEATAKGIARFRAGDHSLFCHPRVTNSKELRYLQGSFQTFQTFLATRDIGTAKERAKRQIAFFSLDNTAVHEEVTSGLGVDRQIDPVIKSLPQELEAFKVHIAYPEKISLAIPPKYKVNREVVDSKIEYHEYIYGDSSVKLLDFLSFYFESPHLFISRLNKFISKLVGRATNYAEILEGINPGILFVRCFYNYDWLALKLAANKLDIPVIDIQHGLVGPYHMAYTHWNRYSLADLNLLPTSYLLWNHQSAFQLVLGNFGRMKDRCLIQEEYIKSSNEEACSTKLAKLIATIPPGLKVTLVLLGPLPFKLPDFFYDFLTTQGNLRVFWLFKAHPTDIEREHLHFVHGLMGRSAEEVFADELASSLPLDELLKHVSLTLSAGSTGLAEALWSGGSAVGLAEEAREQFEHIDGYLHAECGKELMKALTIPAAR